MDHFVNKLQELLQTKPFNIEKAERLSLQIHKAEECGYTCSMKEERLWAELTCKIYKDNSV